MISSSNRHSNLPLKLYAPDTGGAGFGSAGFSRKELLMPDTYSTNGKVFTFNRFIDFAEMDLRAQLGPTTVTFLQMIDEETYKTLTLNGGSLGSTDTLEQISEVPALSLLRKGGAIDLVMTLPTIREDGSHAHTINFIGNAPAPDGRDYLYANQVVQYDGIWFSTELSYVGKNIKQEMPAFLDSAHSVFQSVAVR